MVTDIIFVFCLVYTYQGFEFLLGKGRTAEKSGIDFDTGGWGNYYTLILGVEKYFKHSLPAFLLFYSLFFWWQKKIALQSSFDLHFSCLDYCILLIFLVTVQNQGNTINWLFKEGCAMAHTCAHTCGKAFRFKVW